MALINVLVPEQSGGRQGLTGLGGGVALSRTPSPMLAHAAHSANMRLLNSPLKRQFLYEE